MSFHQPLKGIRVIDFCTHGAGPAACKMLADWGAEVIKVEPLEGEAGRYTSKVLGMRSWITLTPNSSTPTKSLCP